MILVLNPGSSSLKYKVYNSDLELQTKGSFSNIGAGDYKNHKEAIVALFSKIADYKITSVGVRIVHGGSFLHPTIINDEVLNEITECSKLAPLHNPPALHTIEAVKNFNPKFPVVAFFDTSFYAELPKESAIYALNSDVAKSFKIKRYGFHGISHSYALGEVKNFEKKRIVSIHLGGGCSITAIKNGKPIDTSMGFTPSEGLVMQTRSGDIDLGIIFFLIDKYGVEEAKRIVEKESGLKGLTGTDGEMLSVLYLAGEEIKGTDFNPPATLKKTHENIEKSKLALNIYCNRIKKYIGGYAALMGGIDTVIFTGMIGAYSPVVRDKVLEDLDFLNINEVLAIKPDEELAIATELSKKKF